MSPAASPLSSPRSHAHDPPNDGLSGDPDAPSSAYLDLPAILSPSFRPSAHANSLVLRTGNPDDAPPLDLSTPLSRVLFDAQEIDARIDSLASRHALALLRHTDDQTAAGARIVDVLGAHLAPLNQTYAQLEKEVIVRHAEADEVRVVVSRTWETLRLAREVARCLQLGRQLEVQHAELAPRPTKETDGDDHHRALVRCSHTLLSLRQALEPSGPGPGSTSGSTPTAPTSLSRVFSIRHLVSHTVTPVERSVRELSERIVREFSVSAAATFAQGEVARSRTVSALVALYLLSPTDGIRPERWVPLLLLRALEAYVRTALQSSVAAMSRSLGQLPTLERTLGEVVARCQNMVALELVLEATKPPAHPILSTADDAPHHPPPLPQPPPSPEPDNPKTKAKREHTRYRPPPNLLQPLLSHLETGSLASYFWRSMAGSLGGRVQEIMGRSGAAARTLRTNRATVGDAIRDAVVRGCEEPNAMAGLRAKVGRAGERERERERDSAGRWDREVAVMVGSVVNNLGR